MSIKPLYHATSLEKQFPNRDIKMPFKIQDRI